MKLIHNLVFGGAILLTSMVPADAVTFTNFNIFQANGHAYVEFMDFIPERRPEMGLGGPAFYLAPPRPVTYSVTFSSSVPFTSASYDVGIYTYANFWALQQDRTYREEGGLDYYSDTPDSCPGYTCTPAATFGDIAQFDLIDAPVHEWNGYSEMIQWTRSEWFGAEINPADIDGSFSLAVMANVPEPATWAMLLIGFFGVGAMYRFNSRRFRPSD